MQIEIDFNVFKALTALRESEADSYNSVIKRLLALPAETNEVKIAEALFGHPLSAETRASIGYGVWFGSVHLPEATKLRANYKGTTYWAEIRGGKWVDDQGKFRTSPSDAASAISGTNVNGWRFWHAQRPGDTEWRRLDELKG
jgi:hypothetical protein